MKRCPLNGFDECREDCGWYLDDGCMLRYFVGVPKEAPTVVEPSKVAYRDMVQLKPEEHDALVAKHGPETVERMYDILDNYKHSSGKKYKSDYHAILQWVVKRVAEMSGQNGMTQGFLQGDKGKNDDEPWI